MSRVPPRPCDLHRNSPRAVVAACIEALARYADSSVTSFANLTDTE